MLWQLQLWFSSMTGYLKAGGLIMLPLVTLSVVMWTLIINRAFFLSRLYRKNMSRQEAGHFVKTNTLPDQDRYQGAVSLLVRDFSRRRSGVAGIDRAILDETVMSVVSSLDNHLALIGVLATIAPLFGLLGTVVGMVATFDVIASFGTGHARAMAGGIAEALITTQAGLLVAIPAMYMRNYLGQKADKLKRHVSSVGIYLKQYV